jgi:phospholipid transport system transporter-binding protein
VSEPARLVFDQDRMRVCGEVDFSNVVALEQRGQEWLCDQAPASFHLDLSEVNRCNSAVVALLLSWLRAARAAGKQVTIENVPESLNGQMHLAGLESILPAS